MLRVLKLLGLPYLAIDSFAKPAKKAYLLRHDLMNEQEKFRPNRPDASHVSFATPVLLKSKALLQSPVERH